MRTIEDRRLRSPASSLRRSGGSRATVRMTPIPTATSACTRGHHRSRRCPRAVQPLRVRARPVGSGCQRRCLVGDRQLRSRLVYRDLHEVQRADDRLGVLLGSTSASSTRTSTSRRRRWKRRATCRLSGPAAGAAAPRRTTSPRTARRRDVVPPPRGPSPASTEPIVVHPRRPATPASRGGTAGSLEERPDSFGESAPAGNSRANGSGSGGGLVVSAAGRGPSASTTSGGSAWGRGLRGSTGARGSTAPPSRPPR